jgi:hypothetical protein
LGDQALDRGDLAVQEFDLAEPGSRQATEPGKPVAFSPEIIR